MEISTRNWIENFKKGQMYDNGSSYFSTSNYSFDVNSYGVQTDTRFDPQTVTALAMAEPVFIGIFTKIANAIKSLDKSVYEVDEVDKSGVPVKTKKAKKLYKWLKEAGMEKVLEKMLVSAFGTGMGGGVCFPTKKNGRLVFRFEPYIVEGRTRVGFYGDDGINNEITKVVILDQYAQEIPDYTFEGSRLKKYVYHFQYVNPNGTEGFGSNGLIGAMRAMSLRRAFDQTNEAMAKNGMKQSLIASLDGKAMSEAGLSPKEIVDSRVKAKELLQNNTGIRNAGGVMFIDLPLNLKEISLNNSQNRTIEYKKAIEEDLWLTMAMDKANWLGGNAKYSNLEEISDNQLKDLRWVLKCIHNMFEWCLSFHPEYEEGRFIFRTAREVTAEEIKIREAKLKELAMYANNLKILNETFSSLGHSVLPTEEKMATMLSQGMLWHKTSEPIILKPADTDGVADDFTQITSAESINRSKPDFMDNLRKRVNKSFESVLNS
jgi:hypothetical protein